MGNTLLEEFIFFSFVCLAYVSNVEFLKEYQQKVMDTACCRMWSEIPRSGQLHLFALFEQVLSIF